MRKRVVFAVSVILAAMILIAASLEAQNKRMGTASGTQLLLPVGARDLARGGSTIAITSGVEAIHWNPAGLASMTKAAEGVFSLMSYIADISVDHAAVAASFGELGVVGVSVRSINFGDIKLTTRENPWGESGAVFSPTFVTFGLTFARSLTDAISAGGSLKLVSEQIDRVSASGIAIDVGVQYKGVGGIRGLSLGVAVKNIGPRIQYDGSALLGTSRRTDGDRPDQKYKIETAANELPALFDVGLAYAGAASDNMLWNVSSSYTNMNLGLDEYRFGGEVAYTLESVQLFGRAGGGLVPDAQTDEQHIFGATFGAGLSYSTAGMQITIDYAYRSVKYFDANQVIAVKLGF
jgi:hypothetical protein